MQVEDAKNTVSLIDKLKKYDNFRCNFCTRKLKGIKNKNLLKFKNKTLVGHAVNQGYKSKFIKKVYISSDSKKLLMRQKNIEL